MMRVTSLGWGVQSFTLAAMAALGELEPVDVAIHADTTWEREATYQHAEKWTPWLEERGMRVITVTTDSAQKVQGHAGAMPLPAFTGGGLLRRQCTNAWKIEPIRRWLRGQGVKQAEMLMGISIDEWQRAKDANVKWITNRFPLIDKRITRADCIRWLESHELDVPHKSSCIFCPYHKRKDWQELKRNGDDDWQRAVAVDALIRDQAPPWPVYVHPAQKPLEQAVSIPEDYGMEQAELCDGFCMI